MNAIDGRILCRDSDSTLDLAAFESKAKELIERQLEQSLADFITIPTVRHITPHCIRVTQTADQQRCQMQGGVLQGS